MALVSAIIRRGYRAANLIPISGTPNSNETTEALGLLNSFVQSILGNGAGEELSDLDIGGDNDQTSYVTSGIPENVRLVLNLSAAEELDLHPAPYDGQQLAIVDVGANLATYNLVLNGNGRRIEGAASVTLSENSLSRRWFYRADTGNWVRMAEMVAGDTFPFPLEFENYFGVELALLLAPQNSAKIQEENAVVLETGRSKIASRYRRPRDVHDSGTYGLMGQSTGGGTSEAFNRGRAF